MKKNLVQRVLLPLLLFLLVFAVFAPSVRYPLVNLDDHVYITQNRIVLQGLSPANVRAAFSPSNTTASMYMPVLWLSYMADVSLFGASPDVPAPFHAVNVVLHALSSVLLYVLLRRLRATPLWALVLALLWAVHPLRVESVAWVTERKDTLAAVFGLASTLLWLSSAAPARRTFPRAALLFAAALLYAAGLLAKPSLVPLPLAWLALDVWPLRRIPSSFRAPGFLSALLRAGAEKLLCLPCAAAAAWGAVAQHHAVSGALAVPWRCRLAAVAPNFLFYVRKTVLPLRLSPLVPEQWVFPLATVLVSLAVCALLTAVLWAFRRHLPSLLPGAAWTVLFFLPASGLQPLPMNTVADRFFYLPAIGVSIAFSTLPAALPRRLFRLLSAAAAILIALLAALSCRLLPLWSSSLSLYRHAARTFPGHPANAELARHAIDSSGDFPAAAVLLRSVLERDPALCSARFLYADCLLHDDSPAAAARFLLDAPPPQDLANAAALFSRLARYAYFDGDCAGALRFSGRALPLLPENSTSRTVELFFCVAAAFDSGDLPLALSFARQTPAFADLRAVSAEHLLPCAIFLWVDSFREQAASLFLRILDACPSRADIANNILWGFATADWSPVPSSDVLERARHMRDSSPFPDHPAILDTLAAALANDGDFDSAVAAIDRALPQVPPSPFRDSLLERRALYLSRRPCRDNGFERLFSATLGPPADAL